MQWAGTIYDALCAAASSPGVYMRALKESDEATVRASIREALGDE